MSLISDIVERLRSIVFRRRDERELAEELQFHLEMDAEKRHALGANPGEARRLSAIALGGVEQVKEDVRDARGTRWLHDLSRDLAFALRTLAANRGFATVAILTLAIGTGGTTAVYSVLDAVVLQPLPYADPGQLVRLYQGDSTKPAERGFVTPVHFVDYRRELGAFASIAALGTYSERGADIGSGNDVRRIRLLPVTPGYFDVVRVHPRLGRGFQSAEERGELVVVLSDRLWRDRFQADPAAIGQQLTMSGRPYTVVGVMPDGYADPLVGKVDAWVPMDLTPARESSNAGNHYLATIGRLRPGLSITSAQAELDRLNAMLAARYENARRTVARLYPLKDDVVGSADRAVALMLGAVVLVLVLACVNVANLLLVRGADRAREFALRSALGAARPRIVRQTLVESLTLALAGAVAGLVVAWLSMSAMVALGATSIPRLSELHLEPRLLAVAVAIASVSAIAFGLAPALRAARTDPADVLREETRGATQSGGQLRVRQWLVVSQVALAFVLLVGAGLLLVSLRNVRAAELGVKTANLLTFELTLPDARYDSTARARFYEEVAARLSAIPGVRAAGSVSRLPATGDFNIWGTTALTGPLANTDRGFTLAQQRVVAGAYFETVGIPLIEGRLFDERDTPAQRHRVLLSRGTAERLFPGSSAVGQRVFVGSDTSDVIGVVGDIAIDARGDVAAHVYHAHRQFAGDRNWSLTQVVRADGSLTGLEEAARRVVAALDPQLVVYRPAALADVVGRGESQNLFVLQMLGAFAGVALLLAALGLYGILSYGVRLRGREFGIRMALGADRSLIRRTVLREGLTVTLIGTVIGLLGAMVLSRLLTSMVFGVSPADPRVMLGAAVFLTAVAALAAYLPARRATLAEPRSVLQ